jgi:Leucine-rich repeat (LRR) protein
MFSVNDLGVVINKIGNRCIHPRSLRVLRIRGTSITGPIPASLGLNNKLTDVFLDDNELTGSIPASLGRLKKLLTLNLASNRLSGSIPPQLANPKRKLTTLNLSHNRLSGNQSP